jgi:hypothetical protein
LETLEEGVGSEFIEKSAAVFCNFGLHYFWRSPHETRKFLTNLVPFLSEGGRFVATVMRSDMFASSSQVQILNEHGGTEFEATKCNDNAVDVYVASIGKVHRESIVTEADARLRFSEMGLYHVATYSFADLHQMYPSIEAALSPQEIKMSSLYVAYVFAKKQEEPSESGALKKQEKSSESGALFSFPEEVENDILLYLNVNDLVTKIRGLSRAARRRVDTLKFPDTIRWFGDQPSKVTFHTLNSDWWPNSSMGLFLRMGGRIEHKEQSDSMSYRDDYTYRDDYSDGGFWWL